MAQHCGHGDPANSGVPFATEVDRVRGAKQYPGHEDWKPSAPGALDELARHGTHLVEITHPAHDIEDGISPNAVPPRQRRIDLGFDR